MLVKIKVSQKRKDNMKKKYTTVWKTITIISLIIVLLRIILSLDRLTIISSIQSSIVLITIFTIIILMISFGTFLEVTNDKKLINKSFFRLKNIEISKIEKIEKRPIFRGLGWGLGYQLFIYYKDENNQYDVTTVNLNLYSKKSINDFMFELTKINPKIVIL